MQYVALKELPQGQQPGDTFDAHEDVGRVLEAVGAARKADAAPDADLQRPRRRASYQRRDLTATES